MIRDLWQRTKALVGRIFGREPAPGRFESGSKFALTGFVSTAPFLWPSRDYLVYVPKGHSAWKRAPLLVLCHGCKQTPEELAQGARVTAMADRLGCVVLLPRQKEAANPWRCWNWFEARTMYGHGEAAIVAAQIRSVSRRYRIDRKRVLAAGMSAGGALAAVLGLRFPGLVTGVAVHSGLACGAAKSALSAITVMQRGPEQDVAQIGARARAAASRHGVADSAAGRPRRRPIPWWRQGMQRRSCSSTCASTVSRRVRQRRRSGPRRHRAVSRRPCGSGASTGA